MASSIVKSAAQQLGNLVVEEAKFLYKVSNKIESLQTEMEWMECFLRDADTQQHQEKIICKWVSQVRDLAYEAEDIIDRYLYNVSHHRRDGIQNTIKWFSRILCACDAQTLHNLGSDIDELTIKISELTSRLQRYGIQIIKPTRSLEYDTRIREERRTYSHIEEDVVGLKKDIQQVVDQLLQENVSVVSISGIGGLGKTTLARKVFLNKEIQNHYACVWVYISQEFEKTRIFQEILLGLEKGEDAKKRVKELSDQQLPEEIHKRLKNAKCFVVLDDIWTVDAWKRLESAFQSIKGSPSKILLTTRKQVLSQHLDLSHYLHRLKPLSLEDSWKLLQRKALIGGESTGGESLAHGQNEPQGTLLHMFSPNARIISFKTELVRLLQVIKFDKAIDTASIFAMLDDDQVKREKLGRDMLKHCDGIPLAIVALGGILSTKKTIAEWKEVQQNIASYLMGGEQGHENGGISEVLELSYQDLPFYLKPCFLYLGNFPEDYEISTQRLYHLWEAEGLLLVEGKAKKQGQTCYDVGERYLSELAQRSMVQVEECSTSGRIKTCKVHDIMRDLCIKKCEEINLLHIVEWTKWDLASMLTSCYTENKKLRRCAFHWKGDDIDESLATIGKHGEKKKKEGMCVRSVLVFPPDFGVRLHANTRVSRATWKSFPLLRVLDLESAAIGGVLEGVEDLIHLRYLSLRKSCIRELPSRFYDLKCVETLDLRCQLVSMKLPACKLQKMERLRHLYLPMAFEVEDGEKLSFPVVDRMETLKNFNPSQCKIKDLLKMTSLRVFSITKSYKFKEKDVLKGILEAPALKNLGQRLNIDADILKEEPKILTSLAAPPRFSELTVYTHDHVYGIVSSSIGFVDSLERLELKGRIEIKEADVLALGKLPHLKHLSLWKTIIPANKMTFSIGSFLHLNDLHLRYLKELEDWEVMGGALPNLQRLQLECCKKLKKLPQGLPHSIYIECYYPCIKGIQNYNTCPYFKPDKAGECFNVLFQ